MLREIEHVRQEKPHIRRRWFSSNYFDLILWQDSHGSIEGFELCYNKGSGEKALLYKSNGSFSHHTIDDGESQPLQPKQSPIYMPDGVFQKSMVIKRLEKEAREIDPVVSTYILSTLRGLVIDGEFT